MKRLILSQFLLLLGLIYFDESKLNINSFLEVSNANLGTWQGSEMALQAAVTGGEKRDKIIEHCANNKHEKSIEAACLIASRL